jgi:hypothetical protein
MSFVAAGNFSEAQRGWIGWQTIPALALMILGFKLMDDYAKRYDG